ncbi:MAG: helix-turn-helix transcriptional regulator [Clostridiaceae bacterium]|nr:helix-turn-helix transcriptional regulator [Clostridiaceae bacterium]MCI9485108.1 helix-turn-helix transcriptional regulator [Clostridiaceae bacterium]NBH79660.1 XRE family transcriptional regulator [Clostridiaceae bacterium]RKJ77574.1 XRE family transcriptional regulator [Butyricicoccus sp. 1XD8-22]
MLNQQIRTLRKAHKMSQVELAKALYVTKQSVSNWENDNIQPSVEMLVKLAKVFSVSTDFMLGLETKQVIDVTGLPEPIVSHIRQLVDDFRQYGQN